MVVHTQTSEGLHMGGGSKYHVVTFNLTDNKTAATNTDKGVNMDIETITKLLDAGYTKAEIDAMQGADNAGSKADEGAENEDTPKGKEQSDAGAENAGAVKDDVSEMLKALTDTVNGLTTTVKALQDANAKGAKTDKPNATDEIKAAMDSFIAKL